MIRPYTISDKPRVIQLLKLNTPGFFAPEEEKAFETYLDNDSEHYFVLEEDGHILGCGGINYFEAEGQARISWDIVHPDCQGKGIGTELTRHRIREIRKKPEIKTIIVRTSQVAYAFYEKQGFQLERTEKDFWAEGFDLYQMRMVVTSLNQNCNMPFRSTEIRWFATEKDDLWNMYEQLPEQGAGNKEDKRTDHYFRADLFNTGVKIREGNHEIKARSADDEPLDYGVVEHWIKWSSNEEQDLISTVPYNLLGDWLAVEKIRYKKNYRIVGQNEVETSQNEQESEGCGVEFTEIYLPSKDIIRYTIGLEAYSDGGHSRKNLLTMLAFLKLDQSKLKKLPSYGYPEMLIRTGS